MRETVNAKENTLIMSVGTKRKAQRSWSRKYDSNSNGRRAQSLVSYREALCWIWQVWVSARTARRTHLVPAIYMLRNIVDLFVVSKRWRKITVRKMWAVFLLQPNGSYAC